MAFELQRKRRRPLDWRGGLEERRATNMIADARMSGTNFGRRHNGVLGQSWRSLLPWLALPRRGGLGMSCFVCQPEGALGSLRQAGGDERVALP